MKGLFLLAAFGCAALRADIVTCDPSQPIVAPYITSPSQSNGPGVSTTAKNCAARPGDTVVLALPAGASTVTLYGHSVGALTISGTTYIYTPPAHLRAVLQMDGIQYAPSDMWWNTHIDALPADTHTAQWLAMTATTGTPQSQGTFGTEADNFYSVLDGSESYSLRAKPIYSSAPVDTFWPNAYSTHKLYEESGSFGLSTLNTSQASPDHHTAFIRSADDTYLGLYGSLWKHGWTTNCQVNQANCNVSSTRLTHWFDYAAVGGETAASTPNTPLFLTAEDLWNAIDSDHPQPISHALPFTAGQFCQGFQYPALGSTCGNGAARAPMGARQRLLASFSLSGLRSVSMTALGSGYPPNTAVHGVVTGCQGTPDVIAYVGSSGTVFNNGRPYAWVRDTGNNCSPTAAVTFPAPSGGTAATGTVTLWPAISDPIVAAMVRALIVQGQQLGYYLDDIGDPNALRFNANVFFDPKTSAAVSYLYPGGFNPGITPQNTEYVDDRGAQSGGIGTADDLRAPWASNTGTGVGSTTTLWQTNSANPLEGQTVPNQAVIQYSVAGGTHYAVIALQGAGIGFPDDPLPVRNIASTRATYQLPWFVTGTLNTAATWSLTCPLCLNPDPAHIQVSAGGLLTLAQPYTPSDVVQARAKVTLTADPTVFAYLTLHIFPIGPDGALRVRLKGSTISDGRHTWYSANGSLVSLFSHQSFDGSWPYAVWGNANAPLSQSFEAPVYFGPDYTFFDAMTHFVLPAGNYSVRWLMGLGLNGGNPTTARSIENHAYVMGVTQDSFRGPRCVLCAYAGTLGNPWDFTMSASVDASGNLYSSVGPWVPSRYPTTAPFPITSGRSMQPEVSGLAILPDADSVAYWEMGSYVPQQFQPPNSWVVAAYLPPPANCTGSVNCVSNIATAGALQLYIDPHGTNLVDPVWSIVTGPGTLSASGLYLAPATQPQAGSYAVAQAQSASDSTLRVQHKIYFSGGSSWVM